MIILIKILIGLMVTAFINTYYSDTLIVPVEKYTTSKYKPFKILDSKYKVYHCQHNNRQIFTRSNINTKEKCRFTKIFKTKYLR